MKSRILAVLLAATVAFAVGGAIDVAKAGDAPVTTVVKKQQKKKMTHKHQVANTHRSLYPELEPYRSHGFVGTFPGSCAYDRAAGRCMIDLGYGRCVQCDIGGGGRF